MGVGGGGGSGGEGRGRRRLRLKKKEEKARAAATPAMDGGFSSSLFSSCVSRSPLRLRLRHRCSLAHLEVVGRELHDVGAARSDEGWKGPVLWVGSDVFFLAFEFSASHASGERARKRKKRRRRSHSLFAVENDLFTLVVPSLWMRGHVESARERVSTVFERRT